MKKNRMMRLASVLMVMVLLTTSVISGTFAKYVTSASSTDKARVANWGFDNEATINITDLFLKAYDSGKVNSDTDIIAPGTSNSASFKFTYNEQNGSAPEVAYTFEVSTEGSGISNGIKNNSTIQWKLDNNDWGTWDEMIAAIEALDGNATGAQTYAPQQLPAAFSAGDTEHTVYWQWLFEDAGKTEGQDKYDTALGNAENLAEVTLKITITATQID